MPNALVAPLITWSTLRLNGIEKDKAVTPTWMECVRQGYTMVIGVVAYGVGNVLSQSALPRLFKSLQHQSASAAAKRHVAVAIGVEFLVYGLRTWYLAHTLSKQLKRSAHIGVTTPLEDVATRQQPSAPVMHPHRVMSMGSVPPIAYTAHTAGFHKVLPVYHQPVQRPRSVPLLFR